MVYRRYTPATPIKKKKRPYAIRTGRRVGGAIGSLFHAGYGIYKRVTNLEDKVNVESHFNQGTAINMAMSTSEQSIKFHEIAQGTDNGQRVGNSILVKHLNFNGILTRNLATTEIVRLIVVQDHQQIGDTAPAYGDVLDSSTAPLVGMLKKGTLARFKIIYDKTFQIDSEHNQHKVKFFYKFPRHTHIRYNGTASTDIQKNGIYMFLLSNVDASNASKLQYYWRLKYHDN